MQALLDAAQKKVQRYTAKPDYVRWQATAPNGTLVAADWERTACYAQALRHDIGKLEIRCIPYLGGAECDGSGSEIIAKKHPIPGPYYLTFIRMLKTVGLVPEEVKATVKKARNCLIVPPTGWDRHTVYITLCYYRQADVQPGEVMLALELWKTLGPQGTNFLQILHYLALTTKMGRGHYFYNTGPYNGMNKKNLVTGLSLAWFASLSKEERLKICPPRKAVANNWDTGPHTNELLGKQVGKYKPISVEKPLDVLDPKYAPLYQDPSQLERVKE